MLFNALFTKASMKKQGFFPPSSKRAIKLLQAGTFAQSLQFLARPADPSEFPGGVATLKSAPSSC